MTNKLRVALTVLTTVAIVVAVGLGLTFAINFVVSQAMPKVSTEDRIVAAVANAFVENCSGDLAQRPYFEKWDGHDALVRISPEGSSVESLVLRVKDLGSSWSVTVEPNSGASGTLECRPFTMDKA